MEHTNGLKELAKKADKEGLLHQRNGNIKPRNESTNALSYLAQFAGDANYDAQMNSIGDSFFATQEETRFTGAMPRGKREKEYLSSFSSEKGFVDLQEQQAQRQPWLHKTGRGIGRVGVELAANILQMPGYVGGAVAAIGDKMAGGEDSMDIFLNNWWVDSLEGAKEHYNNELAPVYIKDSVKNGNLWNNIKSMDFWATEGASGLAFLLSAFAPGAAITKFGTGLKMANALGKSNLLGKGTGLKILQKSDDITKAVGLESVNNATNVIGATIANTLYESGVEADGGLKSYRDNIQQKYISGEITKDQFLSLSKNATNQAAKIFKNNVAILSLPNLMMSKALFGKAIPKKALDAFETSAGKITPTVKSLTKLDRVKNVGKTVGKAFGSEAVIEEGGQMTSEIYHTEGYIKDFLGEEKRGSVAGAYLDMLLSTEGQKAMFLGTLFGSGAYAFGNHRAKKAKDAKRAELAELMTNGVNFFESAVDGIYKKDENGKIIYEGNEPVIDNEKVTELGSNIDYINKVNSQKDFYKMLAEQGVEGAQEKVDILDRTIMNNMLYTFTHAGEEGIAVLKNYLENSPAIDNLLAEQNKNTEGKDKTKGEFVNGIVQEAEALRSDLEFYGKYGEFKNNLIENNKDLPYYDKYSKLVKNKYAAIKSNLRYLNNAKTETTEAVNKAKTELRTTEESKREDSFNELKGLTVKQLKAKGTQLGMKGLSGLTKAKLIEFIQDELIFDEEQNDMVDSLNRKLKNVNELIEDNNDELKGISSVSKQKEAYSKFKKNEIKREEAEKEAAELDEVLNKLRSASNKTEINQVAIPEKFQTGNGSLAIEKVKAEQAEEWKATKSAKTVNDQKINEEELSAEEEAAAKKAEQAAYVAAQYNKGEQVDTQNLEVEPEFDTFVEANDYGIVLANEAGETVLVATNEAYDALYEENEEFVVESQVLEDKFVPEESDENPNMIKDKEDARIAITDNKKEGKVSPLFADLSAAYKFEISPTDKRTLGTADGKSYYGISLNPAFSNEATKIYNKIDEKTGKITGVTAENFDYLLANLPLAVQLADGVTGPLELKTKGDQTVYNKTSKKIKTVILKELQKGTNIKDISVKIKGQYPGRIQVEVDPNTGLPIENKISDLFYYAGDVTKINPDDFYVSMDTGDLYNSKGETFPTRRQDFPPGEMYLIVKTANGMDFPLKLNTAKVTNEIAEFLHEFYVARSKEFVNGRLIENAKGKQAKLTSNQIDTFKNTFPEVFKIMKNQGISVRDLTIKHITDFFIYDNTKNPKSKVKFERGVLKIGPNSFTAEELENNKQGFVDALTSVKRQQVPLKPYVKKEGKGTVKQNYNFSLTNPEYLKYAIENKVLNTNAKLESKIFKEEELNDPIFQERTTLYLGTNTVKVKGEISAFNEADSVSYTKNLFGSTQSLKKVAPQLFVDGIELDNEIGMYLTVQDRKAIETYSTTGPKRTAAEILEYKKSKGMKRVSSLSPFTGTENDRSKAGQIRGNVADILIREFFSPLQQINTNLRFADRGLELLLQENKAKGVDVQMTKKWFTEELWPIVKHYGELFDREGYTVYGDEFPVMLKIEGERYAGTGDLLVYDNKNKKWGLIDIKTSSINREDDYNSEKSSYKYKEKDIKQQNAYKEAYRQTAKIPITFSKIMPLLTPPTTASSPTNYIGAEVSIGKKITGDTLFDHLLDVDTKKDIYQILGKGKEKLGKKIDVDSIKQNANQAELQEAMNAEPSAEVMMEGVDSWMTGQLGVAPVEEVTPIANIPKKGITKQEAYNRAVDNFTEQLGRGDVYQGTISILVGGKNKTYTVSNPIIEGNNVIGGLIAVDDITKKVIQDESLYKKIIESYNDNQVMLEATYGRKGQKIGPKGTIAAFNLITGNTINTSNSVQQKPGEQNPVVPIKEIASGRKIVKHVVKKEDSKVEIANTEKVVKKTNIANVKKRTGETASDKITKENAKDVYKSLRKSGLITNVNRKLISDIVQKNKGNDVLTTQKIVEFLVNKGIKEETIIENCNL
jgi:hypothetical protein